MGIGRTKTVMDNVYYIYASVEELKSIGVETEIYEDVAEMGHPKMSLQQAMLTEEQCKQLIPEGEYCYTRDLETGKCKPCPFWDSIESFPKQNNGYCHYLKEGDWQVKGIGLLWDMCKHCNVNFNDY